MGHQVIIQPDGKLAIFSSFSDTWIIMDATPGEITEYYARRAAENARRSARETVRTVLDGNEREIYAQFAMTFAEANKRSRKHNGEFWRDGSWHAPEKHEGKKSP